MALEMVITEIAIEIVMMTEIITDRKTEETIEITIITEMIFVADGKKEMARVMSLDAVTETETGMEEETEKEDNFPSPNLKRQRLESLCLF
jgi:hypothetical protein